MRHGRISWLTKKQGGLKELPSSQIYYASTYLPEQADHISVVVRLENIHELETGCEVSLLLNDTPYETLESVKQLDIFNLRKKVAVIDFD